MKKYVIAAAAVAATVALIALDTQAQTNTASRANETTCPALQVTGLKPNEGTLMVAVYSSADTFFKKAAWMTAQKVTQSTMQVPVCNLDVEEISVTAFQDMNGNQKLDINPIGIPTEPYAASGTPALFGAPTWKDTKVVFKGATTAIAIKF